MVNFGGWDMPVEYPASGGLIAEHRAVRSACGLFDVSHMGDIRVHTGKSAGGAMAAVPAHHHERRVAAGDRAGAVFGDALPRRHVVDDVIVHRLGQDDFLLVINAGTRRKTSRGCVRTPRASTARWRS